MRGMLEEVSSVLLIAIGTFLFLFATWTGVTFLAGLSGGDQVTPGDEKGFVQAVEERYRTIKLVEPMLVRDKIAAGEHTRTVLGVPAKDGSGNVWMLLDPRSASAPEVLPDKEFALTPAQFARLEKLAGSEDVKRFLKKRVVR